MKNSSTPAPIVESGATDALPALDFDLPIDREFVSRPPFIDPQAMVRRCEEMMPYRNARPGEADRRLDEKIDVEFVL